MLNAGFSMDLSKRLALAVGGSRGDCQSICWTLSLLVSACV